MPRKRQNFGQARSDIRELEKTVLDLNKEILDLKSKLSISASENRFLREENVKHKGTVEDMQKKHGLHMRMAGRIKTLVRAYFDHGAREPSGDLAEDSFILGPGLAALIEGMGHVMQFAQCPNSPCGCHRERIANTMARVLHELISTSPGTSYYKHYMVKDLILVPSDNDGCCDHDE